VKVKVSDTIYTLKQYRAAIRLAWLKLVKRKQFKRYEFDLTAEWHSKGVPLVAVLKAIDAIKTAGKRVYSLGVLKADIAQIEREQAAIQVGSINESNKEEWRTTWAEDLETLADETSDPERAAMYRELRKEIPNLTKDEALRRWKQITP
jgi:hypothetical protein